jgi:hypothetical protein
MSYPQRMKWVCGPVNGGLLPICPCFAHFFGKVTICPQGPVDELCITFAMAKFTGKQLIHIIHKPLWMTCV